VLIHAGKPLMQIFDFLTDKTVVFFIANSIYVISYMLTSMVWLRVLAIIAAISTFPYFYFQLEPLWSALFWQACFLAVNLVNLLILLFSMRATNFDDDEDLASGAPQGWSAKPKLVPDPGGGLQGGQKWRRYRGFGAGAFRRGTELSE